MRGPVRADELRQRLDLLPAGHPSSPYAADGTARPPVTRLRDLDPGAADEEDGARADDSPDDPLRPLTDAEWADHVADVRAKLEKAQANGLATDRQYTIDPDRQEWQLSRNRLQANLVADLYQHARDVPCDYQALIAGGLGGAGKSTVLAKHADVDTTKYLVINPDEIKEEMARRELIPEVEGLSPMEASDLVHEESSYVAKRLALRAAADGKNIIWDITMSSKTSTERRINDLRQAGYTAIAGIFVEIPVEASVRRAGARHRAGQDDYRTGNGLGGRYVPAEVIRSQRDLDWSSQNRKTFEQLKSKFDAWSVYDNSVDGRDPVLSAVGGGQIPEAMRPRREHDGQ